VGASRGKGEPGHVDRTKGGNRVARMYWLDKDVSDLVTAEATRRGVKMRDLVNSELRSSLAQDKESRD
jgi:hypothetical protein